MIVFAGLDPRRTPLKGIDQDKICLNPARTLDSHPNLTRVRSQGLNTQCPASLARPHDPKPPDAAVVISGRQCFPLQRSLRRKADND